MITAVLLGLGAALPILTVLTVGLPTRRGHRLVVAGLILALVTGAALSTALGSRLDGRWAALVVVFGLAEAAVGGGLVTTTVFALIDEQPQEQAVDGSLTGAGEVLRGGAWIGVLERLAVFATLAGRWPEGVAVVLAVKALGRYPELRTGDRPALAERFIIGTLVSVLWAALCVYAATGPMVGQISGRL